MTFGEFKSRLAGELDSTDCQSLCTYFNLKKATTDRVMSASKPGLQLLNALTENYDIADGDVTKLEAALRKLNLEKTAKFVMSYQESYGKVNDNKARCDATDGTLCKPSSQPVSMKCISHVGRWKLDEIYVNS